MEVLSQKLSQLLLIKIKTKLLSQVITVANISYAVGTLITGFIARVYNQIYSDGIILTPTLSLGSLFFKYEFEL